MADLARLDLLLDRARAALLAGDIEVLAGLSSEVEQAVAADGKADAAAARRLMDKARRNERLLAAAARGVRAARLRLRELSPEGRFSTYDAGGRRDQIGLQSGGPALRV